MVQWLSLSGLAILALCVYPAPIAHASPTIQGVDAVFEGDSVLYSDTNNVNVLWVSPPTSGRLVLAKQQSTFVSKTTCDIAASILRRKGKFAVAVESVEARIIAAYEKQDNGDKSVTDDQLNKLKEEQKYFAEALEKTRFDPEMSESGGFYSYIASSGLVKAMDDVRAKNPGKTVEPIQTKVTSVIPSLSQTGTLPGVKTGDVFILPIGIPQKNQLAALADKLQIDVQLTKLGACLLAYPDVMSSSSQPFKFGFVVNYEYPFLFSRRVTAEYNLLKVYERIERSGTKGGLFSSKSYKDVIESSDLRSALNVSVISDTPLGPEMQLKLEQQARELVLNVSVSQMVGKFGEADAPGKTGAQIASEELRKVCGVNIYCQGTAAGLTILNGIFGSTSQESSFKSTLNHNVKYQSSTGETLPVSRTISYVAD
jgi:hypothetical protein